MAESGLDDIILADCEAVAGGMGFDIVDVRTLRAKRGVEAYIVIYRAEGVSLDDCADVLKTLRPRIQMLSGDSDVRIEVSSPGLGRVIKSRREYKIFRGRGMRILAAQSGEWTAGIITDVTDENLTLRAGDASVTFAFSDIRKAKLDHTQEGV
ncbi:MAG: ribosome maturation factor RimP [Spirochaetales bacterium]|jgi:ribosome maturation factor RimP|nr:ribosome maturation factor RimP [Spirochaetales bacterium]